MNGRTARAGYHQGLAVLALLLAAVTTCSAANTAVEEVICPTDPDADAGDYCTCQVKKVGPGRMLQVKCDFRHEKDALLTNRIYAIRTTGFSSAYVRISNARSVRVMESFMREWQQALSSALDLWHSGTVYLARSPPIERKTSFKTFVGIGIIDCKLGSLPSMLIRDHNRGALRIKDTTIVDIEPGFIHNIDELRYLVFESCVIENIGGPVTTQTSLTLSHRELHTWNGLLMDNVTIDNVAPNSFNITHKSDVEEVVIKDSKFGVVGTGAFVVSGDISVNITDNTFNKLLDKSFLIDMVQKVTFTGNTVLSWSPGALAGLQCPANSSVNYNSVVTSTEDTSPTIFFHPTCGNPEVRVVVTNRAEKLSSEDGGSSGGPAAAVVLVLLCGAGGTVAGVWWWRGRKVWRGNTGDTPLCEDQDQPDTVVTICEMNKPAPTVVLSR